MRALLLVFACSCLASCFIGYDSRWGEAERSQKVVAQHETPHELRGTPDDSGRTKVSVQTLRAYVSNDYAAQVGDQRKQIKKLIGNANKVLEPTLGLRLKITKLEPWPVAAGDLDAMLADLEAQDSGHDIGWVVGFVGRLPQLETSFSELGIARMHGRYLVVRAMNDAAEYDSIAQNLDELDASKRSELYRKRIEHKETAVFLHEIGHTLGVPHEVERTTLMNALYNHASTSYSEEAAAIMRMSLAQRLHPEKRTLQQLARSLIKYVNKTSSSWVAADRDAWLAALKPTAAEPVAVVDRPKGFDAARWRKLDAAQRSAYHRALSYEDEGSAQEAWREAEPLFGAHPDGYEIQDLRCRLAMRIGGPADQIKAHCAAFTRLEQASH